MKIYTEVPGCTEEFDDFRICTSANHSYPHCDYIISNKASGGCVSISMQPR